MKKIFSLFSLGFLALFPWSASAQCPIPNGNFETWVAGFPEPWFGLEVAQVAGRTGGSALRVDSTQFFGFPFPGVASVAFPCSQKSAYLNGYLKANVAAGDSVIFSAGFLLQSDTSTGAQGLGIINSSYTAWTPFHIPIQTVQSGAVDSASISLIILGLNSTVDLDDLAFSNTPLGQSIGVAIPTEIRKPAVPKTDMQVVLSPNPTQQELQVSIQNTLGEVTFSLLDINGRQVLSESGLKAGTTHHLPLNGLPAGVYSAKLTSRSGVVCRKLVIQ